MEQINKDNLPRHIAVIMDGNGRWAEKRSLSRIAGHRTGIKRAKEVISSCRELGIEALTIYAFSTENWSRPKREIKALMTLLKRFVRNEGNKLVQNNIRLNIIGNINDLPEDVAEVLNEFIQKTKSNTGMILNTALSYSGRSEIIQAVKKIAGDVKQGKLSTRQINEDIFSRYLFTSGVPDPDLLIRTSGELRISNFLLWQMAYTEIYVTNTLWPDFSKNDLITAIAEYQRRKRRFGLTQQQINLKPGKEQ
jgi:undecaprenyl diphosphate synthase